MPEFKYSIGRIRAIEARMLDENKLLRMVDAENFQAAYHILNETDYAEFLSFDFETMLKLALQELKKLSGLLAPKNKAIAAFWAKYDYENIKILIKAKLKNVDPPELFQCGNINPKALKEHILKGADTIEARYKELIARAGKIKGILEMFDFLDNDYAEYLARAVPVTDKNAKYFSSGALPILIFLQNKENEIKNIGLILECKKNEVPIPKIKERVKNNV